MFGAHVMNIKIMGNNFVFAFLTILLAIVAPNDCATDCKPGTVTYPSCQCQTAGGFLVDLHRLFEWIVVPQGQPLFNGSAQGYFFSYQPCLPFNYGTECTNVAACQATHEGVDKFDIGNAPSGKGNFSGNVFDDTLNITYVATGKTTVVMLRCSDQNFKFTAFGETVVGVSNIYVMRLETNLVCGPGMGGLSIGSILCIVFAVVVIVYFLVGYFVMYKIKDARGVEAIPNYEFWRDLPGLIKDGFMFVATGCKAQVADKTYQQI